MTRPKIEGSYPQYGTDLQNIPTRPQAEQSSYSYAPNAPNVFDKPLVRIVPDGDLIIAVGPSSSIKAFLVDSHLVYAASARLEEKIRKGVRTAHVNALQRSCRVACLAEDPPQAFEVLLWKLHHMRAPDAARAAETATSESWVRLAKLAQQYRCTELLWFEGDYYLRTSMTPWSLAGDTQNLWNGLLVAHMLGNAEWFRVYSTRLASLHTDSFSKLGSILVNQVLTFKLACMSPAPLPKTRKGEANMRCGPVALEEMRSASLQSLNVGQYNPPSGLCLDCFNGSAASSIHCEQCRDYKQKKLDRVAIFNKIASMEDEKVKDFEAKQERKKLTLQEKLKGPSATKTPSTPKKSKQASEGEQTVQVKQEVVDLVDSPLRVPDARPTPGQGHGRGGNTPNATKNTESKTPSKLARRRARTRSRARGDPNPRAWVHGYQ